MRTAPNTALLFALLAAGCSDDAPERNSDGTNQAVNEMVAEAQAEPPPPVNEYAPPATGSTVPPQLEPMGHDEIDAAGLQGAGCDFTVGEQVLLVAVDNQAIARVDGRIVRLFHAGPLGGTGGFFGSRTLRISVGRIEGPEQSRDEGASWPARIAVTTPTAGQPSRVEGRWSCGS